MAEKSVLSLAQIQKAVDGLLLLKQKQEAAKEKLLEDEEAVNLQFAMKKVPKAGAGTIKLKLPHGLGTQRKEVCLFVKDIDRKDREFEKTVADMRAFLKSKGITNVSEVIPLKALKLEYKAFEAKRNLANMYDIYLADARVIRLLPSYLGKAQPVQVRMDAKDLKAEFEAAINNSRCILNGRGSVGMATVAHTGMSAVEITQNIMASAQQIMAALPGGSDNIRNFHIKTEKSMAIPIFVSFGSTNDVVLPEPAKKREPVSAEEVTTVEGALVRAFPSGVVQLFDETGKRRIDGPRNAPGRSAVGKRKRSLSQSKKSNNKKAKRLVKPASTKSKEKSKAK
ncbi:hypothetical protein BaRGS_00015928 [Batillaria attramentaria]|uniref:Ribosomal protein L1 n=1 Tax=Batillaria attramentaria TaxID=370345 RepID=A0ABD0L0Z6_9CAEN